MKSPLGQIDTLRVLALALLLLPVVAVFGLGLVWLWQSGRMTWWLGGVAACVAVGFGLQQWLVRRDRKLLAEAATEPNADWPPSADVVWQRVQALADTCEPTDWPLDDGGRMLELGRRTLETVSQCYHPDVDEPLLELTVPHALLIVERASRDLRRDIAGQIPFSHRLTIGDLFRLQRWKAGAERAFDIYRVGRMIVNPLNALIGEAWRHLGNRSFGLARTELHRWLLRAYVRKVGYYAIDLYSGHLPLEDDDRVSRRTAVSGADLTAADDAADTGDEPLRILVLGRSNAGKSSLINALFGRLTAATDVMPDTTTALVPYALTRDGLTRALLFDSPGCEGERFERKDMREAALHSDLILWVSAATRPDRKGERECLDALRGFQSSHPERRPPPLLVVVSHIDMLRPPAEWAPPYDLAEPRGAKATNIRDAVQAVAADLCVAIERAIPVCLREERVYNVEDTLWAAILTLQDEALRVRLLRCLDARKRDENWRLLRKQLLATGRFLSELPERLGRADKH